MTASAGRRPLGLVASIDSVARRPAGAAGPFVGRARELAAVAKLTAEVERTGVVLIGGEAGLGKTRLVEEIIAANPGADVVRGGAAPGGTPVPFELIRTAIEPVARTWTEMPIELAPMAEAAHAVFFGASTGAPVAVPLVEQIRAAAETLRALHHEATIYVFDDVHWADPESLEVIDRLLVAGPLGASVLVTYRPEALRPDHPVSAFLQRAERRPTALQIRLEPLRRDEVAEYLSALRGDVGERTIDRVHGRTGGNPLFLTELVGAGADASDLVEGMPWTLAEILRPEIERLPAADRVVAEVVAVLGATAQFDLVAAAASLDEDELIDRLRSLVDVGVLVESGPDRFGYRHELVRDAVVDGLFTRERRRIHAAAFDALRAAGSDDEHALIRHADGAGLPEQAADVAREGAVKALVRGSGLQALALAEEALLVYDNDPELLRVAVSAGWLSQQYRVALDHLAGWDELVRGDAARRAEVLHWRVRLFWEMGDGDAADVAAEELRRVADQLDDDSIRAQVLADLAQHLMLSGRPTDAIEMADQAIELAGVACAPAAALQARTERASALLHQPNGRLHGAEELARVATDAEVAGDYIVASRALNNLPVLAAPDPRRHLERMRAASQRAGLTCIATVGYRHALLDLAKVDGDRKEFEAVLDTALADMESDQYVITLAAMLAVGDGRFDEGSRFADLLDSAGRSVHPAASQRTGLRGLVELQRSRAVEGITEWLATAPLTDVKVDLLFENLTAILDAGLHRQVADALAVEPATCCWSGVIGALAAELGGDLDVADARYADILASSEGHSAVALAEMDVARARIARAKGHDESDHLASAARRLRRWPGLLADRLAVELGTVRVDDVDPQRLTPREREVALLVTEGRTNGGIADELFISTKTASVHVSNILSKLGAGSRTEIAAWVAAGGLPAT